MKHRIGKIDVSVVGEVQAIAAIVAAIYTRSPMRVAFANAHLVNLSVSNERVEDALDSFFMLNDGIGVDLASWLLYGRRFPANLNGTDFVPNLLDNLKAGSRIYLIGAEDVVVRAANDQFSERWPQLDFVGFSSGFFSEAEEIGIAEMIRDKTPDLVLVGMGCPRQELWLARNVPGVCPVGIGVGALLDFHAGKVRRAPVFMRKLRLEWVFRLILEPRRLWRRYIIGNVTFLSYVAHQWRDRLIS